MHTCMHLCMRSGAQGSGGQEEAVSRKGGRSLPTRRLKFQMHVRSTAIGPLAPYTALESFSYKGSYAMLYDPSEMCFVSGDAGDHHAWL